MTKLNPASNGRWATTQALASLASCFFVSLDAAGGFFVGTKMPQIGDFEVAKVVRKIVPLERLHMFFLFFSGLGIGA